MGFHSKRTSSGLVARHSVGDFKCRKAVHGIGLPRPKLKSSEIQIVGTTNKLTAENFMFPREYTFLVLHIHITAS
jgi:hypothetical protein